MQKWYHIFPKNRWLSIYAWIIFCILPFYFLFRLSAMKEIVFGIMMILLFFAAYRLSFISKRRFVSFWVGLMMVISIGMTLFYGYVYFALFLAFFIGNIRSKSVFFTSYIIHFLTTLLAVIFGFFTQGDLFMSQFPFILVSVIGVILLPFNMYNRNKQEKLESQLEDANKKIAELMVIEERQRIARDLHDTLGQKLSLIGLKSDLASKLLERRPFDAKKELLDIQQTARTALKEVREMVSGMRGVRLDEEINHCQEILAAAQMECTVQGNVILKNTPLLVENVISMCLKEIVTNVVKHSKATRCAIMIEEQKDELKLVVCDNGIGMSESYKGNGLRGICERLDFVNGTIQWINCNGLTIDIRVPHVIFASKEEE